MSSSRNTVLERIRGSLMVKSDDNQRRAAVSSRLKARARNTVPDRTDGSDDHRISLMIEKLGDVSATVDRLDSMADIPSAVASYLKTHNLPATIRQAPHSSLTSLPWNTNAPMVEVSEGRSYGDDENSLTACHVAVAETGTLMLESGAEGPTTLNFLPDNHIVVVRESQIVGTYEDGWDLLREKRGVGSMPRTVNFVTGASRTGDIEQTILLGAHGPRRLHVLLVKD
jgi:L-lactate dehydrogenase complex protein LldG